MSDRLSLKKTADAQPMIDRRVIFVLEPFAVPQGGGAVIHNHAETLNRHGNPAFVATPAEPPVDFYGSNAPLIVHGGRLPWKLGDVFVILEILPAYMKALGPAPVKRLMFCQNEYCLPFTSDRGRGFAEFGVHGVIASSEAVRSFLADVYGLADILLIPCAVDPQVFSPKPEKKRQIAFMPRKLPEDAAFIRWVFRRRHPRCAEIPWVAIDNRSQREAAEVLAESEVFLSLSHKESLGLPPLQAMACGCLVAGFHGDGGREYATENNGWWAETGDWKACVDGLAGALNLLDAGGDSLMSRRKAMSETVARYSPANMELALLC